MIALHGMFILEPYQQGQGIRSEIRAGLAMPGQKLNLVPLTLKADTEIGGVTFKAGQKAYVPEDILMTQDSAKKLRKSPNIEGEFIVLDGRLVVGVE